MMEEKISLNQEIRSLEVKLTAASTEDRIRLQQQKDKLRADCELLNRACHDFLHDDIELARKTYANYVIKKIEKERFDAPLLIAQRKRLLDDVFVDMSPNSATKISHDACDAEALDTFTIKPWHNSHMLNSLAQHKRYSDPIIQNIIRVVEAKIEHTRHVAADNDVKK